MHDSSIASQVEDWIVSRIAAIQEAGVNVFQATDVLPWEGSTNPSPEQYAKELFASRRDVTVRVFFQGDDVFELEEGAIRTKPTFIIAVGIQNFGELGQARRGDGTTRGTNRLRDLIKYALHDQQPKVAGNVINDGKTAVDRVYYRESRLVLADANKVVMALAVDVDESPMTAQW